MAETNTISIASDTDVLDSISIVVEPELRRIHTSVYYIVSVPNVENAVGKLERAIFNPKFKLFHAYVFTSPLEDRAHIYFRLNVACAAHVIANRFKESGMKEVEVRIRLGGVKKSLLMKVLRGGFEFGKYMFPPRPLYREVRQENLKFEDLFEGKWVEKRQRSEVGRVRATLRQKKTSSDDE